MAHLRIESKKPAQSVTVELTHDTWVLSSPVPTTLDQWSSGDCNLRPTLLVCRGSAADTQWVLLAGREANVRVNGSPMGLASCVLQDHDEILLGDAESDSWRRCYFMTTGTAPVDKQEASKNLSCRPGSRPRNGSPDPGPRARPTGVRGLIHCAGKAM